MSVEVELTYLARNRDNTQAPTLGFTVDPGQSMTLEDVVQGTFGTNGSGALLVKAQQPLVVVSRTFNEALTEVGAADAADVRAEIEVLTDGGRVIAYASTVDNRTGDPVFQTAWTHD